MSAHGQMHRMCEVSECIEIAQGRNKLCSAHLKRRQRGQSLDPVVKKRPATQRELLSEAALAYAEASDSDEVEYERAWERLRYAARAYCGLAQQRIPRGRRRRVVPGMFPGASPPAG